MRVNKIASCHGTSGGFEFSPEPASALGTNRRQRRPRPRSEWRIIERPELRIVDAELWSQVRDRLEEKKNLFGNGGGLYRRATSSPYLLTGFLKCGLCGGNLQIVCRDHGAQLYGCPQHYGRGTCENRLKIRRDQLEAAFFRELQKAVLDPETIDYIVTAFGQQLKAKIDSARADISRTQAKRVEIEKEIVHLTAAIAEAGHSKALLGALAARERELEELTAKTLSGPDSIDAQLADLCQFVTTRLENIAELVNRGDMQHARTVLARHADSVRLIPVPDDHGRLRYVLEGNWNFLGKHPTRWSVAGGGFEPPTFGL